MTSQDNTPARKEVEFRSYDRLPEDVLREKLVECEEEISRREQNIASRRRKCEEDTALDEEQLVIDRALRDQFLNALEAIGAVPRDC